jgi:DNA-binding NtrC family response regulator
LSETLGRILIVDDEPDVLEMLRLYFAGGRFEVMTASGGAEAVSVARRVRPHAVLLDVRTPPGGMDRVQAVRAFQAVDPRIAVVMATRSRDDVAGREAQTIGAFAYVPKPFDFDVLDDVMMAAVAADLAGARPWRTAIAS